MGSWPKTTQQTSSPENGKSCPSALPAVSGIGWQEAWESWSGAEGTTSAASRGLPFPLRTCSLVSCVSVVTNPGNSIFLCLLSIQVPASVLSSPVCETPERFVILSGHRWIKTLPDFILHFWFVYITVRLFHVVFLSYTRVWIYYLWI